MSKTVFGLVGPIASGKGVVAKILQKRGFKAFSLSDVIREELRKKNLPITRKNLQDEGDGLRKRYGSGILAKRVVQKIKKGNLTRVVVDSIRNPVEIDYLKKAFPIKIIGITAKQKKRFEYLKKRNYLNDPKTWEEFLKADNRELKKGKKEHQIKIKETLVKTDIIIKNNKTLKDLELEVKKVIEKLLS